jgi:hypothetical protein
MKPADYQRFSQRLLDGLAADERILGLVALGSMSGEPPLADEWSDHDFFVICHPGEQERLRTGLSWLPDAGELAFWFRETAHGVKALYRSGHLLEFAVFDLDELQLARINRSRTLLDRVGPGAPSIESRLASLRLRTSQEAGERRSDPRWLAGQLLTSLLVAAGRHRRGERMSGRALLQGAAGRLVELLARAIPPGREGVLDTLDPFRRLEQAFPQIARDLDEALGEPVPLAALRCLGIARRELAPRLREFPDDAAAVVERQLADQR